ncbi:hypothetical protein [Deinococcus arenicola]|uniref:Uncharacterized protein n=1 Tax=Deinococcus arenicola TaxID=2994950 RepID=A0ABU4DMZ5_9DEIO|nr:hypothetical protein [Deinococcus sp. ZS9-10]MDV6373327.1 hypothetical protein [Deinococcus sp. ZS9-10]
MLNLSTVQKCGLIGVLLAASAGAQTVTATDPQALRGCGGEPGAPAWAEAGVYSGTLGSSEVTLELARQPITPEQTAALKWDAPNHYFYAGRADNLGLTTFRSGNTLILQEQGRRVGGSGWAVTGCFTLEAAGQGWHGTWKAPGTANTLKVNLKPLDVARVPLHLLSSPGLLGLRKTDPLTFLKLNQPWKVTPDRVREPLTGLNYPRVPDATPALNRFLQDRLLEHAEHSLSCAANNLRSVGTRGEYSLKASVTLLTPRLLSITEDSSSLCGGPHPFDGQEGLILDRAKGRVVPLEHLWPSLTPARLKELYLQETALGAASVSATDPGSGCDEALREMSPSFSVNLTSIGLSLTPTSLPYVLKTCISSVVVLYSQLQRGANTGSPYYADLYRK